MPEGDLSAARARIEVVDRRLAALQDLGIDTAALRSQLALAQAQVDEGGHGDAQAVLDEVAEAARRLAAGATARASEWRGLPRERVVEELRRIVAEGGAGEAVTALREHVDDRLRDFERRLRDQFARELAQIIAARPWAKDLAGAGGAAVDLDAVRAEVDALVGKTARDLHAELDQLRRLASEPRPADPSLRDDLDRVRREVEALGRGARGADPAQLRQLVDEALANRAAPPASPRATGADDLLRGLVVQAGEIQNRLSERLLGLEHQLGGLVQRLTPAPAAAPAMAAFTPPTALTSIHIVAGTSGAFTLPLPDSGLRPAATTISAATHLAVAQEPGDPPSGADIPVAIHPSPAAQDFVDPSSRFAVPVAAHLPPVAADPADPPSGSDWIFPNDDSRSMGSAVPTRAADQPGSRPQVAIEQKQRLALADASEAKTAAIGIEQGTVTGPIVHNDDRPPGFAFDEARVRRLVEERLATWRPSHGDELVADDAEQARQLIRLLPTALRDQAVRNGLFAALALEATAHPGVLAELTGLRGFLRRELNLAVEGLKKELGVGV